MKKNFIKKSKQSKYPEIKAHAFISCGNACRPAYWLRKYEMRKQSLPFDWMKDYTLQTLAKIIKEGMHDWFEHYEENEEKIGPEHRYVKDTLNEITSIHAFPVDKTIEEYMPEFKATYQRRYEHLINVLSTSSSVCLVGNRTETPEEFFEFIKALENLFPQTQFIVINVHHSEDKKEILKYKVSQQSMLYYIYAYDKYEDPTSKYAWHGNTKLWQDIFSRLKLFGSAYLQTFKIFNFIPLLTYKEEKEKKEWAILGILVWKIEQFSKAKILKSYLFGLPLIKIKDK